MYCVKFPVKSLLHVVRNAATKVRSTVIVRGYFLCALETLHWVIPCSKGGGRSILVDVKRPNTRPCVVDCLGVLDVKIGTGTNSVAIINHGSTLPAHCVDTATVVILL